MAVEHRALRHRMQQNSRLTTRHPRSRHRPSWRAALTLVLPIFGLMLFGAALAACGDGPTGVAQKPAKSSSTDSHEQSPGKPIEANGNSAKPPANDATKPDASTPETGQPKYAKIEVKPNTGLAKTDATIAGKRFKLEIAATPETRRVGLMAREKIDADGGMVFVFPSSPFMVQSFWMGDCLTDMDILYLDGAGRIMAMHEMKVQRRLEGESDEAYSARTTKYSSKYRCGLAVELAPGSIKQLGLKDGDLVKLDVARLKKLAQ